MGRLFSTGLGCQRRVKSDPLTSPPTF
ncbi:exopolygalacturonate lyase [Citrobacter freundii]|uniref:Exopolygalacturonate lyase n=1 Tax=Citrobacter freundii TaxID=546 RepID=A0AB33HCJ9_CITFR|nr:exopolygalacturonate lyase [Citrobacter freundii]AYL07940.1 exopolygalacturonate lyase [Enterobacter kobei]EGT3573463.1 exopolygalacturonate lyase [Citrobacter amalonaticus]TKU58807.1 exopolygalacturonate lyase [Citrobacter sp. wls715]MBE8730068.1 exopolygalacturonate lyase [Citrobacter freundii]